jgi:hypothetical protein
MEHVKIRDDTAHKITLIAASRQIKPEALVNEILEEYVANQNPTQEQSGAAFLLSIAGMFNSGPNDTSEHVPAIVTDFIQQKYREDLHDGSD